ncbi:hypothetical protein [Magnetospirillum sp. UT-4]|uniref:hypothetical protein n=1 Tax=Magnetospirillum sp. UT-4 TaxID=2681467 RepID=UPI001385967C|nr:hypothetical protein [Magnetospirillum sp. UT-4]CAA7621615.1 conserved hypothetical protein [Magnetospirillum sp. UT-4]
MTTPTLPPPVDIDSDTKKAIIDGLKKVLARLQEGGLVDQALSYQDLISHPDALAGFVTAFATHRATCDDIVKPRDGSDPVRDDDAALVCGVSLNQIQQLLVRTCAKKVFESEKTLQTVTETKTKTALFGLIKKTEQVEVQKMGNDPVEERKVRELSRYIAFGWQLALLPAYREHLSYPQIIEIGEDIVALHSAEAVATVGQFPPDILKKVKAAAGPDFADILVHRPQAIAGVAVWNRDMYEFYRKTLGEKAWDFFAREKEFFNVVAALDKANAKVYGDVLCYIAAENLEEVQRLNIDKAEVLVTSMKSAFGAKAPAVLGHPGLAKAILRQVVDNLLHMSQEKDKLMVSFALTCKAMVPNVLDWLSKQPK